MRSRRRWWLAATIAATGLTTVADAQTPAPSPPSTPLPVSRLEGAEGAPIGWTTPAHPRPDQLAPLPVTQLDDRPLAANIDGPRTVSLTLSQALPIAEVLMLLVRGTPFSIVTDAAVSGTFIGELKELTMRQALEAVLFPLGLDYALHGNVIRVFPRRTDTRLFEVNSLNVRRSLQHRAGAPTTIGEPPATSLLTTSDSDAVAELGAGVQALLSPSGRFHVDRKAGLVQVTDFAERLDRVAAYLEAVHVRASRQVRLDARVLEVTASAPHGIDWTAVASRAGSSVPSAAPDVPTAGLRVGDPDVLVRALAEQGTVRMIAAPRTVAMNNEPAVMRAGTNDVYFAARSRTGGARRDDDRADMEPSTVAVGLTLTVTPHISADGIVQLSIAPTWAEKTGQVKSPAGDTVPVLRVAEADTLVRVREGETVVISGLLQERTEARTSPGFSGFFGAQERRTVRAELVVLLTPTVVIPSVIAGEGVR